jgi:hypothetical protein
VEEGEFMLTMNGYVACPANPLASHMIYAEGNMACIAETILIDILQNTRVVENVFIGKYFSPDKIQTYIELFKEFHDVFSWSYEEIPGIDPQIVEHEIRTYPDAKPVRKKLCPINP